MIIGSCGFGGTGSSVLTDLLREYDDVQIFDDFEFTLAYKVDGLQDLEYHLMKQYAKDISGEYAIKRFLDSSKCYYVPFINKPCPGSKFYLLSKEFVNRITQIKYKGMQTVDVLSGKTVRDFFAFASKKIVMPKIITRMTGKRSYIWPCRNIYYSVEPSNFYEEARKYVQNVILAMGADLDKPICLDQPFEGNVPEQSFPFFEDPYAVVIDRDPRDLYFDYKYSVKSPDGKFAPHTTVQDFVTYYKNMRRVEYPKHDRVLRLNFEALIYDYDNSIRKIEKFLHLGMHIRKREIFNPDRSINNTQLLRLHPDDKEEVDYIERELREFLFPFEKYPMPEFKGKPFVGAARNMTDM